jgi:hypothetical protein
VAGGQTARRYGRTFTFPRSLLTRGLVLTHTSSRNALQELLVRTSIPNAGTHSTQSPLRSAQLRNGSINRPFKIGNLQTYPIGSPAMCT